MYKYPTYRVESGSREEAIEAMLNHIKGGDEFRFHIYSHYDGGWTIFDALKTVKYVFYYPPTKRAVEQ